MTTEHTAVFHCQECGRIIYQPRGGRIPACCGELMVCAIADLVRDTEQSIASREYSTTLATSQPPTEKGCRLIGS